MENNNQPDWEIGKLYNQAWKIIKENRVLWLFGMALGGLSFNFGGNGGSGSYDGLEKLFKNPPPSEIGPQQITHVLGAATENSFFEAIGNLFSAVPSSFYIILLIEFVCLMIAISIISLVMSAWANASLLKGIQTAIAGKEATIADSSEKAFPYIKPLIWLSIIPMLIIFGLVLTSVLLVIFTITVDLGPLRILMGILGGLMVGAVIYSVIFLALSSTWATRIVVFENKEARAALRTGYTIAKKKFWAMLLLGLVNTIVSGIVVGVPLLIIAGFIFGGIAGGAINQLIAFGLLGIGVILIIAFIFGFMLLGGVLNAFKTTVWTIAYNNIREKYV